MKKNQNHKGKADSAIFQLKSNAAKYTETNGAEKDKIRSENRIFLLNGSGIVFEIRIRIGAGFKYFKEKKFSNVFKDDMGSYEIR